MNHVYKHCRESGFSWALTFVIIATLTVVACIKQEKTIAEKSPVVMAMSSNALQ